MKQTSEPKVRPSPSSKEKSRAVAGNSSPTTVFVSMVLDMTWRLAIVVLVPIILGVELDKHYKTHHDYLIAGFVIALLFGIAVVYRSYKLANDMTTSSKVGNHAG
ncbi:MAG: AtpZ/AtpI family protein [Candidatus Saccharibacteria bacterium]